MEIKLNRLAIKQLFDIIQYLEENDSIDYAEKLEKKVLSKIKSLLIKQRLINLIDLNRQMMKVFMLLKMIATEFHIENWKRKLGY